MTQTDNALDTIRNTDILTDEDFAFLETCSAELEDTWAKRQIFRTETEMRIGVLDDLHHPTRAAKYWQAVREQAAMFEQLVMAGFEYRRNEIDISRIEASLQRKFHDRWERESLLVDLDERRFRRVNIARTAADRIRELRLWSAIKTELDDGTFNTRDPNAHQFEAIAARLEQQAAKATFGTLGEACNIFGQLATIERLKQTRDVA